MNLYEVLYVIATNIDEETNRQVIDKFAGIITENKGEITAVNEWGKRRLAYPIDYKTEGYYVLVDFKAPAELPRELERNFKNDERILRYMVIRKDA